MAEFNGKYKAFVKDINDPKKMGRIRVDCPAVSQGYLTGWCEPCFPCEEDLYIPPVGSCVWVEFCGGDLTRPLWLGGWYAEGKAEPNSSVRFIRYAGAEIKLADGLIYVNGIDLINELKKLQETTKKQGEKISDLSTRLSNHMAGGGH